MDIIRAGIVESICCHVGREALMQVVQSVANIRSVVSAFRQPPKAGWLKRLVGSGSAAPRRIGFVPTMGALHEGHLSLIRQCRQETDIVVVSVFVNPTQFGSGDDLDRYPHEIEHDTAVCKDAGVDVLFAPSPSDVYPAGYATYVLQERYTDPFEGEIRTGHFHGVCTICAKLFNMIQPDVAYFGQKDYQQTVVIRRMLRDLNFNLDICICPIVRESDGLAMSSRNAYLSPEERSQAVCLNAALQKAEEMFEAGERRSAPIITAMEDVFGPADLAKIDYLAVVNPESLREIRRIESEAIILVAARFGDTRLIDNTRLSSSNSD